MLLTATQLPWDPFNYSHCCLVLLYLSEFSLSLSLSPPVSSSLSYSMDVISGQWWDRRKDCPWWLSCWVTGMTVWSEPCLGPWGTWLLMLAIGTFLVSVPPENMSVFLCVCGENVWCKILFNNLRQIEDSPCVLWEYKKKKYARTTMKFLGQIFLLAHLFDLSLSKTASLQSHIQTEIHAGSTWIVQPNVYERAMVPGGGCKLMQAFLKNRITQFTWKGWNFGTSQFTCKKGEIVVVFV